jgi:hypothetical protein
LPLDELVPTGHCRRQSSVGDCIGRKERLGDREVTRVDGRLPLAKPGKDLVDLHQFPVKLGGSAVAGHFAPGDNPRPTLSHQLWPDATFNDLPDCFGKWNLPPRTASPG